MNHEKLVFKSKIVFLQEEILLWRISHFVSPAREDTLSISFSSLAFSFSHAKLFLVDSGFDKEREETDSVLAKGISQGIPIELREGKKRNMYDC